MRTLFVSSLAQCVPLPVDLDHLLAAGAGTRADCARDVCVGGRAAYSFGVDQICQWVVSQIARRQASELGGNQPSRRLQCCDGIVKDRH